jgi:hypothetical protein
MTTDILFPFYDILVNTIFGSIGVSLVAVGIIMILILGLCRCGWTFIAYWMTFYVMVVTTLYLGGLGMVLCFVVVATYFVTQIVRLAFPDR